MFTYNQREKKYIYMYVYVCVKYNIKPVDISYEIKKIQFYESGYKSRSKYKTKSKFVF